MDFKLIVSTFVLIFLAELGDKTQFAAMAASAGCNKPMSVLLGASLALVLSTVLAVVVGSLIGSHIPVRYIKVAAGALFIVFGLLYLKEAFMPEKAEAEQPAASIGFWGDSVIKAALVFEQQELKMLQSTSHTIQRQSYRVVINKLILEEEEHLRNLSEFETAPAPLTEEEKIQFSPLVEEFPCCDNDSDSILLQDLYNREMAMADFYHIMAEKSKIAAVKQSLYNLYQEELVHSTRIRSLLVDESG